MSALLEVENLRMHFFTKAGVVKAVDDVSFRVQRGRVLGLVGESGSGKSMTGYSIMGLVDPPGRVVGGRILLAGRDLAALPAEEMRQLRGNRIAMIFQDPMMTLNPVLRIDTQMVETILAHEKIPRAAALDRARAALVQVGIPSPDARLKAYPHQFSGGMRQRVAIAIALLDSVPGNAPAREKLKQISGMTPSLIELPPGCAFRSRCPYATAECEETPEMRPYGAIGQSIRCFHPLSAPTP